MSAGLALLFFLGILAVIIALAVTVPAVVDYRRSAPDREALREARTERDLAERRANMAVKGLRAIANGAGNPILEASDCLDRIETTYPKEIS